MEMSAKMGVLRKELKKTSVLAAPMVVTTLLQYLMQVVSLIMVGHLGRLSLSAVAIATALTNVTGFSLLVSIYSHPFLYRPFSFSFLRIVFENSFLKHKEHPYRFYLFTIFENCFLFPKTKGTPLEPNIMEPKVFCV